jgi:hypothetical protein
MNPSSQNRAQPLTVHEKRQREPYQQLYSHDVKVLEIAQGTCK